MADVDETRLRRIGRLLTTFDLQEPDPEDLSLGVQDIEMDLGRAPRPGWFLDYYSRKGLEEALKQYGVLDRIAALGFQPRTATRRLDSTAHLLRMTDAPSGAVLVELVARLETVKLPPDGGSADVIAIDWLLMQNPRGAFSAERPRLPGQDHPGLGLGRVVIVLLAIMADRLEREGLLAFPEFYHLGLLYGERFRFRDPAREGELRALRRDLAGLDLATASWAVELGLVTDGRTGSPYRWQADVMVYPATERLRRAVSGAPYDAAVEGACEARRFTCDRSAVEALAARLRQGADPRP